MEDAELLRETVAATLSQYLAACAAQTRTWTADLSDEQFWTRPHPYGNSIGHLVLHITGNLSYFIGTEIAGTGYVRNRDLEFTDTARRPKHEVLAALDDAVAMAAAAVRAQSAADWCRDYAARGTDDRTRFAIVFRCVAHFHHHLGQIIYLAKEHARRAEASRRGD